VFSLGKVPAAASRKATPTSCCTAHRCTDRYAERRETLCLPVTHPELHGFKEPAASPPGS